jgi:protein-disulfide isomerase
MKRLLTAAALVSALVSSSVPTPAQACDGKCPRVSSQPAPRAATPRREAPTQGPEDARVTLEVWSDFQCPFCARGAERLAQLRARYGEKLRIVFRHSPLPFHEHARLAAAASMAAHAQGRFWEFHDALFAQQGALDRKSLEALASKLGLDMARFQRALDTGEYDSYLEAEVTEARQRGVTGTPTFFINDSPLVGARPLEDFTAAIDAAL